MRIFIPRCGTRLRLGKDWTFQLQKEFRNWDLWCTLFEKKLLEIKGPKWKIKYGTAPGSTSILSYGSTREATLPSGTELRVERVYIRAGTASEYDSVTFRVTSGLKIPELKKLIKPRFWVKISEVNGLEVYRDGDYIPPAGDDQDVPRFLLLE